MICNFRIIGFGVAATALLAVPAAAAEDMFANLYSNTIVYTSADKTVSKVHADKDGSWTSTSTDPKHPSNSGKWARLDGWLCSNATSAPKATPWCRRSEAHKVGDKWTETRPDKSVVQVELVAGR